ncbi:MAG: tRNA (adenosine(37)-N6)-threonylcarbamoyltransferase complex ATPase subunit type 1 TsaE [Candidatus Omnitrophota bacterium]|nr:tRNA (adenosine(37)-N6)-threonylcarbamoyltransferase complex ATPase subunit type 1 TsaE [Candidatus Omnitrophota bacterium]
MKIISKSVKETLNLGSSLARQLKPGDIICLKGNLGSGKTTLTKGIAIGLGIDKAKVTSSSFILIRQHPEGSIPLFHFDLYRLKSSGEIAALGFEEYLYDDGVSVIEWAEKLECLMPQEHLTVKLAYYPGNKRVFEFLAQGARYKNLLRSLRENISH